MRTPGEAGRVKVEAMGKRGAHDLDADRLAIKLRRRIFRAVDCTVLFSWSDPNVCSQKPVAPSAGSRNLLLFHRGYMSCFRLRDYFPKINFQRFRDPKESADSRVPRFCFQSADKRLAQARLCGERIH